MSFFNGLRSSRRSMLASLSVVAACFLASTSASAQILQLELNDVTITLPDSNGSAVISIPGSTVTIPIAGGTTTILSNGTILSTPSGGGLGSVVGSTTDTVATATQVIVPSLLSQVSLLPETTQRLTSNIFGTIDSALDSTIGLIAPPVGGVFGLPGTAGNPGGGGDGASGISDPVFNSAGYLDNSAPTGVFWNSVSARYVDHDGYSVSSLTGSGQALGFESKQYNVMPGTLFDVTDALGLKKGAVKIGAFGGVGRSFIDFKSNSALRSVGITEPGEARVDSLTGGLYGLGIYDNFYGAVAVSGGWGRADVKNHVLSASSEYDTNDIVVGGIAGMIVPLGGATRLDFRSRLDWSKGRSEAHTDTLGIAYGTAETEVFAGSIEMRLFTEIAMQGMKLRPFIHGGIRHQFDFDSDLTIAGTKFEFSNEDTSGFAKAGVDFALTDKTQSYISARTDFAEDYWSVTGQFGFIYSLN